MVTMHTASTVDLVTLILCEQQLELQLFPWTS